MSSLRFVQVRSPLEMQLALAIRRRVFIEEQGVPEDLEIDEYDTLPSDGEVDGPCQHVLAFQDGQPVATGRLVLHPDGRLHIGRVAVLPEHQGRGLGREVMDRLHVMARQRHVQRVTLAAQLHAIGFYEKLGYVAHGDVFLDAGIEHRWMDIDL
jgi:predicted GNAT family N-acyltransferase